MSWIVLEGTQVLTGTIGSLLEDVFSSDAAMALTTSLSSAGLSSLPLGNDIKGKTVVSVITGWLEGDLKDDAEALFTPIKDLSKEDEDKRTIGWPNESFKKSFKGGKAPSFSLDVNAKGIFAFTLGQAVENSGTIENTLEIAGEVGAKAGSDAEVSKITVKLGANFDYFIGATWTFERPNNDDLAGLAFAEALNGAAISPDNLQEVANAPASLKSIKLTKSLGYGADASAKANIPISLGGVSFGLSVGYQSADKAVLEISRDDSTVKVKVDVSESDTLTTGYSLGVKIGIPDVIGDVAKEVAKKIKGADELLGSDEVQKLLQPSKLLDKKLKPLLQAQLKKTPLMSTSLKALLDRDADGIAATLSNVLGDIIDDVLPLDPKADTEVKILNEALDRLSVGLEEVKKDVSGGLAEVISKALKAIYGEIPEVIKAVDQVVHNDASLKEAITALGGDDIDENGIKTAVATLRKKLKDIAKAIEEAVNENLSMSFAYKRVNKTSTTASGTILVDTSLPANKLPKGAYKDLVNSPLSMLDEWLPSLKGKTLIKPKVPKGIDLNDAELFERWSRTTEAEQSLSFAKVLVSGKQTTANDFFIHRSLDGVMAGSRSAVEESSFWFGTRRQVEWEGLFGHIDPKNKNTVRKLNPNQILYISMTHAEKTLDGDDIDRVFTPIEAIGVVNEAQVDALQQAAKTHQEADGTFKGSVNFRMAFMKADFDRMLNTAFPVDDNGKPNMMGNPSLWRDIAHQYIKAVRNATDYKHRKLYRKAYGFLGDMAHKLGMPEQQASERVIADWFMRHDGADIELFNNNYGSALQGTASDHKARNRAGRMFFAPRQVREALLNCMALNEMLGSQPDVDEAVELQSNITKALSNAMYVDASSDAVTPSSAGLYAAFATLARHANVKPAIQLSYKSG